MLYSIRWVLRLLKISATRSKGDSDVDHRVVRYTNSSSLRMAYVFADQNMSHVKTYLHKIDLESESKDPITTDY